MTCDDLFRFGPTNIDVLTETYHLGFYCLYLSRWPGLATSQESGPTGRLAAYCIGKARNSFLLVQLSRARLRKDL
jgi:N-terminal acetyltransferase B complex catalytic subunit